ncbi:MAG: hypothetical protein M3441_16620 [Chloroflexota bacterium]|nr:hypothetical protein [Chloroflexota bacterium]
MKRTVFYSWEKDLPNATNWSFIETALENAAKALQSDDTIEVEAVVDRDTRGVPGAPDIANTIFSKIERADVFVADVSIINWQGDGTLPARPTPNPNVLVELGYAIHALGWDRVLLVMNTTFGPPEALPFDLRTKRAITYAAKVSPTPLSTGESSSERSVQRKQLSKEFERRLRDIFAKLDSEEKQSRQSTSEQIGVIDRLKTYMSGEQYSISLHELVSSQAEDLYVALSEEHFSLIAPPATPENIAERLTHYEQLSTTMQEIMSVGGYWATPAQIPIWNKALQRVANPSKLSPAVVAWYRLSRYPALLLLYAGGISAIANSRYETFASLLTQPLVREPTNPVAQPAVLALFPTNMMEKEQANEVLKMAGRYTPLNDHLHRILRDPLRKLIPDDADYDQAFDKFEYLLGLVHADLRRKADRNPWGPVGRFLWSDHAQFNGQRMIALTAEAQSLGNNWPLLTTGLFDGSLNHFLEAKQQFDELINSVRWQLG